MRKYLLLAGTALTFGMANDALADSHTFNVSANIVEVCGVISGSGGIDTMNFGTIGITNYGGDNTGAALTMNPETGVITVTADPNDAIGDFTPTGTQASLSTTCEESKIAFECVGAGDVGSTGCVIGSTTHRLKNITMYYEDYNSVYFGGTLVLDDVDEDTTISGATFRVKSTF